jgi:hypothetical protein
VARFKRSASGGAVIVLVSASGCRSRRQAVRAHCGVIRIRDITGEGCVFTIDVPLAPEVVSVSGTNLAYGRSDSPTSWLPWKAPATTVFRCSRPGERSSALRLG